MTRNPRWKPPIGWFQHYTKADECHYPLTVDPTITRTDVVVWRVRSPLVRTRVHFTISHFSTSLSVGNLIYPPFSDEKPEKYFANLSLLQKVRSLIREMLARFLLLLLSVASPAAALYSASSPVVQLNPSNFNKKVLVSIESSDQSFFLA